MILLLGIDFKNLLTFHEGDYTYTHYPEFVANNNFLPRSEYVRFVGMEILRGLSAFLFQRAIRYDMLDCMTSILLMVCNYYPSKVFLRV